MTKRRIRPHSREWHAARLAEGPHGFIRERGATSWEQLRAMCRWLVSDWERLPPEDREFYAYPNPEDRRR